MSAARPTRRIAFLDSLRFVAAAAVLLQHGVEQQGPTGQWLVGLLSPGVFGVVLFFLISGFVIPMSVGKSFDWRIFAIRRLFRIYPLVLVTFALVALIAFATALPEYAPVRDAGAGDWIANLLLVQDYVGAAELHSVTWTLSIEFAWYALFALLFVWQRERFDLVLLRLLPLVLLGGAVVSLAIDQRIPLARPGMLYAAALGAQAWRYHAGAIAGRRLLIDAALFLAVMAACNDVSFGHFSHPTITLYQALIPWLLAPLLFLAVAAIPRIGASRLMTGRTLSWLGAMSFSTYLLHPFAMVIAAHAVQGLAIFFLGLLLTFLLSILGYYLIELPMLRLSKRLTPSRPIALPLA